MMCGIVWQFYLYLIFMSISGTLSEDCQSPLDNDKFIPMGDFEVDKSDCSYHKCTEKGIVKENGCHNKLVTSECIMKGGNFTDVHQCRTAYCHENGDTTVTKTGCYDQSTGRCIREYRAVTDKNTCRYWVCMKSTNNYKLKLQSTWPGCKDGNKCFYVGDCTDILNENGSSVGHVCKQKKVKNGHRTEVKYEWHERPQGC